MLIQPSTDFKALTCVWFLTIYFSCSLDFTHFQNGAIVFTIFPNQQIPVLVCFQCHLDALHLCFLRVYFVVCPRNGSGTDDLLGRSTLGIYRYCQLLLMTSTLLSQLDCCHCCHHHHPYVLCNNTPRGPGCLAQWRTVFSSSCTFLPIIALKKQHVHQIGSDLPLYMKTYVGFLL